MTSASNTTTPATAPDMPIGKRVASAVGDLETPINDAVTMVQIASHLIETMVTGRQMVMGNESFVLSVEEGDLISWAIYHAEDLAKAAKAEWAAANTLAFELRRAS